MAKPLNNMSDPSKPPSHDDLGDRISKLRKSAGLEPPEETDADVSAGQGLGVGWRISIEIVTAIVVCTGIGWSLDYWLGTRPWLMLLFMVLGAAAGINNAVRTALRMDAEAAERMKRAARRTGKTGETNKRPTNKAGPDDKRSDDN